MPLCPCCRKGPEDHCMVCGRNLIAANSPVRCWCGRGWCCATCSQRDGYRRVEDQYEVQESSCVHCRAERQKKDDELARIAALQKEVLEKLTPEDLQDLAL